MQQTFDHDEVRLVMAAPPEAVYEAIADVTRMPEFSPEVVECRWVDGATGPAVGARFKGSNKRGIARWSTTNQVVEAEPGATFSFETQQSGMRWTYRIQADGTGSLVSESRSEFKERPAVARIFTKIFLGGVDDHDDELRAGMRQTLERVKAIAES